MTTMDELPSCVVMPDTSCRSDCTPDLSAAGRCNARPSREVRRQIREARMAVIFQYHHY